jgi:hypothetical protein
VAVLVMMNRLVVWYVADVVIIFHGMFALFILGDMMMMMMIGTSLSLAK